MTGGSGKVVKGLAVGTEVQVGRSDRGDAGTEVLFSLIQSATEVAKCTSN
jgi:hypothetical protein